MQKRVDRDSPLWAEITEPEGLQLPPAKRILPYHVCELTNNKYSVLLSEDDSVQYIGNSEEEACVVCRTLINAYKMGVADTLNKLNTFSVDMRRKHGILWGDGRNDTDH